jgi:hypothetical protein
MPEITKSANIFFLCLWACIPPALDTGVQAALELIGKVFSQLFNVEPGHILIGLDDVGKG